MTPRFFTIGHSNRSIVEFVDLLRSAEVQLIVDVRRAPSSRSNPQYNRDALAEALAGFQIGYEHMEELGGHRGKSRDVEPSINAFWLNQSFHNFADYAMTGTFRSGFDRLRELGHERRCAIMCSEAVWWRCHRRIIADYLVNAGEDVFHILNSGRIEPATLTTVAKPNADGTLAYPIPVNPQGHTATGSC